MIMVFFMSRLVEGIPTVSLFGTTDNQLRAGYREDSTRVVLFHLANLVQSMTQIGTWFQFQ